jgi:acetyl-CoA synthetase (ADP-forming)
MDVPKINQQEVGMEMIERAKMEGRTTLSEYESKLILRAYGIPVTREIVVSNLSGLAAAASEIGFPLVMKGSSAAIAHKTEKGVIAIDIRNQEEATIAFQDIQSKMDTHVKDVLVQEMIKGQRELVVGMTRDPQFGPCVMFGLGGIFTEVLKDVSFRVAPLEKRDAREMMEEIKGKKILDSVRGLAAADREALADILMAVGKIGLEQEAIAEIDINPLKLRNGKPVAVDALVVLKK